MTAHLSTQDEAAVCDAIGALEIAEGLVPTAAFPALADPSLRKIVAERLHACGRVLLGSADGWTSGYRDDVADILVDLELGMLSTIDRAVLALVLLRTVAIPRARGEASSGAWVGDHGARATTVDELAKNRSLPKTQIKDSLRRLRTLGLLRPGHRAEIIPGPALHRLTPQRAARLWEDLLILAAPQSTYAQALRARHAATPSSEDR